MGFLVLMGRVYLYNSLKGIDCVIPALFIRLQLSWAEAVPI